MRGNCVKNESELTPGELIPPKAQIRFAVFSDIHLAPTGTSDGRWNNVTRLSVGQRLLDAAVTDAVSAGHDRVLLLGDISDRGSSDVIATALAAVGEGGLEPWSCPGNHDVISASDALLVAADSVSSSRILEMDRVGPGGDIVICGHGLHSDDGGRSCTAIGLPNPERVGGKLLLWVSHYPVFSQKTRLVAAGLRYPGDLQNLEEVQSRVQRFRGPVLILHGHLHTSVVYQAASILQIGVPALVEWPHAWTDVLIGVSATGVSVRTRMISVKGDWSSADINTVLDEREQYWLFTADQWSPRPNQ